MSRRFITPGAAICCALALAVSGWAMYTRARDVNSLNARRVHAWHLVVCYLETLTANNKTATAEQKADAIAAYDHILDLVGAEHC